MEHVCYWILQLQFCLHYSIIISYAGWWALDFHSSSFRCTSPRAHHYCELRWFCWRLVANDTSSLCALSHILHVKSDQFFNWTFAIRCENRRRTPSWWWNGEVWGRWEDWSGCQVPMYWSWPSPSSSKSDILERWKPSKRAQCHASYCFLQG